MQLSSISAVELLDIIAVLEFWSCLLRLGMRVTF